MEAADAGSQQAGSTGKGPVRVAILGAGRIAHHMAQTLQLMRSDPRYRDLVEPYAVASRSLERAQVLSQLYAIPHTYGSYQELLENPNVDLVYIATPHSLHAQQAKDCLEAGKHILVEKSFTLNAKQAQVVIDLARSKGLLCAEAIWTRYMPSRDLLAQILSSETIGKIRAASASLCYPTTHKPRIVDPALGGGALLDVGVYSLNFIDMVFGGRQPKQMQTTAAMYATGVDESNSTTLVYADGSMGVASSSMSVACDRTGSIWGSEGYIVCHNINNIEAIDVYGADHQLLDHHEVPGQLTGYEYEVEAAARAIQAGQVECPQMPHNTTIRMMEWMDAIRAQWGMHYPSEA
ncbi:oxidoreductase [Bombiscardovia apis]|uniref:Oxidoreductase n=1 Tax=Bombiscardovia apis TaxID=2932182 RepID=A0ABN6SHJ7_9BIFI|nr:Gfo/Idh/MocA family oxidoreductase [Bombiscardovia apis]BDR54766.1 oxidoreductase [Bombiscardovia apis]